MDVALRQPVMARDQFLDWAQAQERRYEFDGFQPVAMTGGTVSHSRCTQNVQFALRTRLRGSGCEALDPDAGLATLGNAVRYPDALVTCTKFPGTANWTATALTANEILDIPELGISVPVHEFYEGVDLPDASSAAEA